MPCLTKLNLAQQPSLIQQTARRVRNQTHRQTGTSIDEMRVGTAAGSSNSPVLRRGYDVQSLGKCQGQVVVDLKTGTGNNGALRHWASTIASVTP